MNPSNRHRTSEIEVELKDRICGQERAVDQVIPWIKRLRFGLPREGRPAAVFLLLGPSGVGKTQLARELAKYVFGDEGRMLHLDVSQFQSMESISRLNGAPPGFVGYGQGLLTSWLRDHSEGVVLFTGIERTHVKVFDLLMRFAETGCVEERGGPVREGHKVLIVMTSDAGQNLLRGRLQEELSLNDPSDLHELTLEAAWADLQDRGFRTESFRDVDEVVCFLPLSQEACRRIVDGCLAAEQQRFKEFKDVTIEVEDEFREALAKLVHTASLEQGARAAHRTVLQHVVEPAIDILIRNECANGPRRLIATVKGPGQFLLEESSWD